MFDPAGQLFTTLNVIDLHTIPGHNQPPVVIEKSQVFRLGTTDLGQGRIARRLVRFTFGARVERKDVEVLPPETEGDKAVVVAEGPGEHVDARVRLRQTEAPDPPARINLPDAHI